MEEEKSIAERIEELEMKFIKEDFKNKKSYMIKEGRIPILIAAPHSVTQFRKGLRKPGQYRTGVLAEWLHEETGCFCAYKTRNDHDDANHDFDNPFKYDLIRTIKKNNIVLVISLHIMSHQREHMVEIGTRNGENLVQNKDIARQIKILYKENNIDDVEIDKLFVASDPYRLTSHISRTCQIDALQIIHNWRILDTTYTEENFMKVYETLKQIIDWYGGS